MFASFTRGGGMGLDEMTGSPNLTIVARSRDLPRAAVGAGRRLDSVRRIFQRRRAVSFLAAASAAQAAARLARAAAMRCVVGARDRVVSAARRRRSSDRRQHRHARACAAGRSRTSPVEPGYLYHSESNMDLMQPVFDALATRSRSSGCRCARSRTSGARARSNAPSRRATALRRGRQRAAVPHRDPADLPPPRLFRDLHVPARRSRATIPAAGICISRSPMPASGRNLFMPRSGRAKCCRRSADLISAGCCSMPCPRTVFATPTVNGYRRFRPNSLAPDRAGWGYDHRGAMIRVLGGARRSGDPAGEPHRRAGRQSLSLHRCRRSSPGSAGIERKLAPPPADDEPYAAERPMLPKSLPEALDALEQEPLFRRAVRRYVRRLFRQAQAQRRPAAFERSLEEAGASPHGDEPTDGNKTNISISSDCARPWCGKIEQARHDGARENPLAAQPASAARRSTTGIIWCRRTAPIG